LDELNTLHHVGGDDRDPLALQFPFGHVCPPRSGISSKGWPVTAERKPAWPSSTQPGEAMLAVANAAANASSPNTVRASASARGAKSAANGMAGSPPAAVR